ncbi:hypothetical protein ACFFGT_02950 [Mucilaginibacter angelicae]|uniref:Uncharacterized protein n=1 Tax=Mucilaginibacter angelicae TaxID=869718 RepID=A0ABV6L083_9SPHI
MSFSDSTGVNSGAVRLISENLILIEHSALKPDAQSADLQVSVIVNGIKSEGISDGEMRSFSVLPINKFEIVSC